MPRLKYPRLLFVLLTSLRIHTKLCFVFAVSGIKISVTGKQAITSSQNFLLFISFLCFLRSCLSCSAFLSFFLHLFFILSFLLIPLSASLLSFVITLLLSSCLFLLSFFSFPFLYFKYFFL
jgi:hypothetical protein